MAIHEVYGHLMYPNGYGSKEHFDILFIEISLMSLKYQTGYSSKEHYDT